MRAVADHINECNSILTQLTSVGIVFDDEVKALILLSSLPESWSGIVTSVSSSMAQEKLKLNDVRDLVLSEDIRRRSTAGTSSSALYVESSGRGRSQSKGGRSVSRSSQEQEECYLLEL